jgi:hypothetical protein
VVAGLQQSVIEYKDLLQFRFLCSTFMKTFNMRTGIALFTLLCSTLVLQAQPGRPRDTVAGGGNWQPWHVQALQVPSLLHPVRQKTFMATEKLCFDKKIFVKGSAGGRTLDTYLYINTEDGYVGIMNGREGTLGNGEFNIDNERFNLLVIGKKGNTFNYYTRKKKGNFVHYVSTSNSEQFQYQFGGFTPSNDAINKKTERNEYCGGKFKTWGYKANGADAPMMHVFGRTYPNKLVCKDFLGHAGVGYLNTDAGMYLVCQLEKGSFGTEMREFDDIDICFDPAGFTKAEETMYADIDQGINKQKEKLENKTYSGTCSGEQESLKQFKLEKLNKKKGDLEQMQQGNVLQNTNTQKAYAAMMDPVDMAEEAVLDLDVQICKTQDRISRSNGDNSKAQQKLSCLGSKKGRVQGIIVQMKALDTRYANQPGKAHAEKMKLIGPLMEGCN